MILKKIRILIIKIIYGKGKINIDCSPFNGDWGRPQNDGPALRGIMMIKIINLLA